MANTVPIPLNLLFDIEVGPRAIQTYGVLWQTADGADTHITHRTLASTMGITRRTVIRSMNELQAAGWVQTIQQGGRGYTYRLNTSPWLRG